MIIIMIIVIINAIIISNTYSSRLAARRLDKGVPPK